jgi:23S rRNA (uridine2552-2'-O)-methyltransferase
MGNDTYRKPDFWALKAKEEGYPARSIYKLKEIDEKFRVFRPGLRVLDLGAAPGSWSAYAIDRIGPKGFIAAIDLAPLASPSDSRLMSRVAGPGFFFIKGDLYDPGNRAALLERGPYGIVMSDAAPFTTGNAIVDSARSEELVNAAVSYAREALAPGGAFIAKLFQGQSGASILKSLKGDYADVRGFKPTASRPGSFEMYIVATGKRARK